jgi:hypothetical protein
MTKSKIDFLVKADFAWANIDQKEDPS